MILPLALVLGLLGANDSELFTLNGASGGKFHVEQISCWLTHTTPDTHEIIRSNLRDLPLFWKNRRQGPRYCPSIEDKVVKFPDKQRTPNLP